MATRIFGIDPRETPGINLPMSTSFTIAVKSLRVRFFRNAITVLTLVLAVAFLTFVLVSADMANGLLATGNEALISLLSRAGYDVGEGTTRVGASAKERWIVILSMLVCTVGIVNAQLMAVTERFREIGTMKCLGALDTLVLRLFLIEAGLQGLAGAVLGTLLGLVVSALTGLVRFGTASLVHIPTGELFTSILMALAAGLGLTILGVLYPAIVAARMRPVEAMRYQD